MALNFFAFGLEISIYGLRNTPQTQIKIIFVAQVANPNHKSNLRFVCLCCVAISFWLYFSPVHYVLAWGFAFALPAYSHNKNKAFSTCVLFNQHTNHLLLTAMDSDISSSTAPILLPLSTIHVAFEELAWSVHIALCTQMGDAACLGVQKMDCLQLLALMDQVSGFHWPRLNFLQHAHIIPVGEHNIIDTSLWSMITYLDNAVHLSSDPPDAPPLETSYLHHTGDPGWPSIQIPPRMLATALGLQGATHLAQVFDCSARTIHCWALEYGLAEPGPPIYIEYEHDDGSTYWFYTSSTGATSDVSDDELDVITAHIVETFPNFGHCMIDGHLKCLGHHVPWSHVQASYARVHGAPVSSFGSNRIQCRVYSILGPNLLCHHDEQHGETPHCFNSFSFLMIKFYASGLIRWKIIFHGFIDGFSWLVTGIQASNNNCAETVFLLFWDMIKVHGILSCMRGDHGVENGMVARWMEAFRGFLHGSYIWGWSTVHYLLIFGQLTSVLG